MIMLVPKNYANNVVLETKNAFRCVCKGSERITVGKKIVSPVAKD